MDYQVKSGFNTADANVMHIDINSCFATIEQQANPFLRGKVLGVAPYMSDYSTIIAASREAKGFGIKTGFKVGEAKKIYPGIIIVEPDVDKYKAVHNKMYQMLQEYSAVVDPKSIDEFVVDFNMSPYSHSQAVMKVLEIKQRIREEIGDWITVSVGMGPNRFLAKTGAGLKKPDGFEIINHRNYIEAFRKLDLKDLCGIASQNALRLNRAGIFTVEDFYSADLTLVKSALKTVGAYHWYMKLRGWETEDFQTHRGSFSHSYILKEKFYSIEQAKPIINKLCVKLGWRMRSHNYMAQAIYIGISYHNSPKFKNMMTTQRSIFQDAEIYKECLKLLKPNKTTDRIRQIEIACFKLHPQDNYQLDIFQNIERDLNFYGSVDTVNKKWGRYSLIPSVMMPALDTAPERISFGKSLQTNLYT